MPVTLEQLSILKKEVCGEVERCFQFQAVRINNYREIQEMVDK